MMWLAAACGSAVLIGYSCLEIYETHIFVANSSPIDAKYMGSMRTGGDFGMVHNYAPFFDSLDGHDKDLIGELRFFEPITAEGETVRVLRHPGFRYVREDRFTALWLKPLLLGCFGLFFLSIAIYGFRKNKRS